MSELTEVQKAFNTIIDYCRSQDNCQKCEIKGECEDMTRNSIPCDISKIQ